MESVKVETACSGQHEMVQAGTSNGTIMLFCRKGCGKTITLKPN